MAEESGLLTIGQLSRRSGVPVRTIRFWSDRGVVPSTTRSGGGYRLYDTEAAARLDLVRTLRELGLGLQAVERVLCRQATLHEVAAVHARALDAQIGALTVRRSVLRWVSRRTCTIEETSTIEEMRMVNEVARLSAAQRQQMIDDFVEETFAGIAPDAPGAGIAQGMRALPVELPEDPGSEQVEAWVELAGLVADPAFRTRARQMAVAGSQAPRPPDGAEQTLEPDPALVLTHAAAAVNEGVDPASPEAVPVLAEIVDPALPRERRLELAERIELFSDRRVERYWQLLGVINGWPAVSPRVPAFEWVAAALRAQR